MSSRGIGSPGAHSPSVPDDDEFRNMWTDSDTDSEFELSDDGDLDGMFQGRKKRNRGERKRYIDPDAEELIGKANAEFQIGNLDVSIKLAEEAIKIDPEAIDAYNLLTAIYDERGNAEKALIAKVAAAHLNKKSKDDWLDISARSIQLGHLQQAAVFYQHVSRLARDDWQVLYTRAEIHFTLGQYSRALTLLSRIRTRFFSTDILTDDDRTQVLLYLARVYKNIGRISDATDVYSSIYNGSLDPTRYGAPEVPLNWQNLNVLGELLFDQKLYARAIRVIRDGARWILDRSEETWWKDAPDDSEFDNRRYTKQQRAGTHEIPFQTPSRYELPIDIRSWLLVCRLKQVGQNSSAAEDALVHLEYLRQTPIVDYSDLYTRAAHGFFQAKMYQQALDLYTALTDIPYETESEYLSMLVQVAKSQMELGNIREAEDLYLHITSLDESHVEALVALGEIFQATGRPASAKQMVERVYDIRDRERRENLSAEGDDRDHDSLSPENRNSLFVEERKTPRPSTSTRLTLAEKAEMERKAQVRADAAFEQLDRFDNGLQQGNMVAAGEWIRAAQELIQMYASNRKFFPTDRNKIFPYNLTKSAGDTSTVDERLAHIQQVAREDAAATDEDVLQPVFKFRGRTIDVWFSVFMRCALAKARFESVEGAYAVVRTARSSNVFTQNTDREQTMRLVDLACAHIDGDAHMVSDTLRHMYMNHQFSVDILRLYGAFLSSGYKALGVFGSSNNQKFFLRQIKALDSVIENRVVAGAARVNRPNDTNGDETKIKEEENPMLFIVYANIMLASPSYVPALTYLMRALEKLPDNPVLLLTIGVIYVQRAIQRVTTNRHIQILQGLTYMQAYIKVRQSTPAAQQEAQYNMGRVFHGLGLFSLAIPYYERVLSFRDSVDETHDFSREAAYNLHLIYAMVGNFTLSRQIVDEYLVL